MVSDHVPSSKTSLGLQTPCRARLGEVREHLQDLRKRHGLYGTCQYHGSKQYDLSKKVRNLYQ